MARRKSTAPVEAQSQEQPHRVAAPSSNVVPLVGRALLEAVRPEPDAGTAKLLRDLAADPNLIGAVVITMYRPGSGKPAINLSFGGRASTDAVYAAGAVSTMLMLLQEKVLKDTGLV